MSQSVLVSEHCQLILMLISWVLWY